MNYMPGTASLIEDIDSECLFPGGSLVCGTLQWAPLGMELRE